MNAYTVPTREEVSESDQAIFDNLQKGLGFVPNLYAYYAKSETALGDYLQLQNRKTTLRAKEKEIVNLVTSEINRCRYCQSAHTAISKNLGFTDEEILDLRLARAPFNEKFDALAKFTKSVVENRGNAKEEAKEAFFAAGYTEANMIDTVIVIADKTVSNYIHNLAGFEIDFPIAPELELATV
jgi:uncharacterized peroxidase-related enzyme